MVVVIFPSKLGRLIFTVVVGTGEAGRSCEMVGLMGW